MVDELWPPCGRIGPAIVGHNSNFLVSGRLAEPKHPNGRGWEGEGNSLPQGSGQARQPVRCDVKLLWWVSPLRG
jgi:hypothetical protein